MSHKYYVYGDGNLIKLGRLVYEFDLGPPTCSRLEIIW